MDVRGMVYIIGAGPGDPGLVTIAGVERLKRADVIVYDYLVGNEILSFARRDARMIYVGKRGGHHTVSQEELNSLLVKEAKEGRIVARLKGGDPFIFGRGGEEAEVLEREGIPFEIVPGVTSAIAVPAYAGIPLTHREHTSVVAFVTGHEDPEKEKSAIDWEALAKIESLVFLMGVKNLAGIAANLIGKGKPPSTPVALVRRGTTPDQETLAGTLGDIAGMAEEAKFSPPAILVVGDVVRLRERLNWYEKKSLFGKGVVITRPEEQSEELAGLLRREGARVISFPTVRIEPPESFDALDGALAQIQTYGWIIFTSANGVRFFFERMSVLGGDIRDLKGVRICTIGPATQHAVETRGIRVDVVPGKYISEGVVEALSKENMKGAKVLIPRATVARDIIPERLVTQGAAVDVVPAYRTVNSGRQAAELLQYMNNGRIDVITFTSPSTVKNFMEIMGGDFVLPEQVKVACIGPVTREEAERVGLPVDIMQEPYVIAGLVEAIIAYYGRRSR
jgi:uroporphyrinogen III methyltransferase / synthase